MTDPSDRYSDFLECGCSYEQGVLFECAFHRAHPHAASPPSPDGDWCARCHEHAEFALDTEGSWRSTCCGALAVPLDVEEDQV